MHYSNLANLVPIAREAISAMGRHDTLSLVMTEWGFLAIAIVGEPLLRRSLIEAYWLVEVLKSRSLVTITWWLPARIIKNWKGASLLLAERIL